MQQPATWTNADHAPEYPPAAGAKTSTDTHPATETATEARQGVTGQGVRYVLIFGILGVVIAFAAIYAAFLS
jgi:cobalamin biosynthesis Mg chelatase CobN